MQIAGETESFIKHFFLSFQLIVDNLTGNIFPGSDYLNGTFVIKVLVFRGITFKEDCSISYKY